MIAEPWAPLVPTQGLRTEHVLYEFGSTWGLVFHFSWGSLVGGGILAVFVFRRMPIVQAVVHVLVGAFAMGCVVVVADGLCDWMLYQGLAISATLAIMLEALVVWTFFHLLAREPGASGWWVMGWSPVFGAADRAARNFISWESTPEWAPPPDGLFLAHLTVRTQWAVCAGVIWGLFVVGYARHANRRRLGRPEPAVRLLRTMATWDKD